MNTFLSRTGGVLAPEPQLPRINPLYDSSYRIGFVLVFISALLFTVPLLPFLKFDRNNLFVLFFFHNVLVVIYALVLKVKGRLRLKAGGFRENIGCLLIVLVLILGRGLTWQGRDGGVAAEPGPVAGYQREVVEAGRLQVFQERSLALRQARSRVFRR